MNQHISHSDNELVERFRETSNLEILGTLYQRYMHLVYGVCLKYLKHRENAQDAVMQIFEVLVIKLPNHEVNNFKSWLYALSKNYCLMQLRKQNNYSSEVDFSLINMENEAIGHPTNEPDLEENIIKLEKCIDKLKEEQQACVKLFYLEKKCYQDICEITSFELNKVKSYIQNGKRNLKICLEQSE